MLAAPLKVRTHPVGILYLLQDVHDVLTHVRLLKNFDVKISLRYFYCHMIG